MRRHALTDSDFTALGAGRPSPEVIDELRRGQHGRHLLLARRLSVTPADLTDPLFGAWAAARLRGRVTGPPPPVHAAVRFLTAEHDGMSFSVRLEDRDVRRGLLGLQPSDPLTDAEAAHWQRCLTDAWRLLVTRHRDAARVLADVLTCVVPVESDAGAAGISATSADAFGAVAISRPVDAGALAVGLLHEAQHSLLNATSYLFDLHLDARALGYSPWRDDPRPASGVLHGAYAYLAVTRFWRTEARATGDPLAAFEYCRWREAVASTAERLLTTGRLTAAGRRFTGALLDEVRPWLTEAADPRVGHLARLANDDHYVRWRLRNLRVDVDPLVDAFRRGDPPPAAASRLETDNRRALSRSPVLRAVHNQLRAGGPVDNSAGTSEPSATFPPTQRGGGGGGGRDAFKINIGDAEQDGKPGREPDGDPRRHGKPGTETGGNAGQDNKPGRKPDGDPGRDGKPGTETGADAGRDGKPGGDPGQDDRPGRKPGADAGQDDKPSTETGADARQDGERGDEAGRTTATRESRVAAVEAALLAGDFGTIRRAYEGKDLDLELTPLIIAGGVGARAEEVAALVRAGGDPIRVIEWLAG